MREEKAVIYLRFDVDSAGGQRVKFSMDCFHSHISKLETRDDLAIKDLGLGKFVSQDSLFREGSS